MDKCPFTGKPCPYPKIIHVTDLKPDYTVESEQHHCQVCGLGLLEVQQPAAKVVPPKSVLEFIDLVFIEMGKKVHQPGPPEPLIPTKPPCPNCGYTLQDIRKSARLGCGTCYEHFRTELLPVIIHSQHATEHCGKRPKNPDEPLEEKINRLKLRMTAAIEQERYEEAAKIRDQLKELQGNGSAEKEVNQ